MASGAPRLDPPGAVRAVSQKRGHRRARPQPAAADADLPGCRACPRLASFLDERRRVAPGHWNRPVPADGPPDAAVLLVGLAPGLGGANRTGRPFVGDASGAWVYAALAARGLVDADGRPLVGITNAVKCVPPKNLPTPAEQRACRERWLAAELAGASAEVIVALGAVAHAAVAACAGARLPFTHGAEAVVTLGGRPRHLLASFHPSPLNTRTGRLDPAMFDAVLARATGLLAGTGVCPTPAGAVSSPS